MTYMPLFQTGGRGKPRGHFPHRFALGLGMEKGSNPSCPAFSSFL